MSARQQTVQNFQNWCHTNLWQTYRNVGPFTLMFTKEFISYYKLYGWCLSEMVKQKIKAISVLWVSWSLWKYHANVWNTLVLTPMVWRTEISYEPQSNRITPNADGRAESMKEMAWSTIGILGTSIRSRKQLPIWLDTGFVLYQEGFETLIAITVFI